MTTLLLAIALALHPTAPTPHDALLFARACTTEGRRHNVDPALLCAVAWVESRWTYDATNRGHCGAWQQSPRWSQMWGDDCWKGAELACRQPGGAGVTCEELVDVPTAARVAARHLSYLQARYPDALCRYAGATGERCGRYVEAVERVRRLL